MALKKQIKRITKKLTGAQSTMSLETQLLDLDNGNLNEAQTDFDELVMEFEAVEAPRQIAISHQIGKGRQGVVFEGYHIGPHEHKTRHALKIFNPGLYATRDEYEADLKRVARQASALQKMYHPNLVHCEGFCYYGQCGIKIMELIDGIDLYKLANKESHDAMKEKVNSEDWEQMNSLFFMPEGGLTPGITFYILRKILRGIERLHKVGYIHCDIKPDNVMVDRFGTVKLIDFGRAVPISGELDLLMGSPMYMAPEVLSRQYISPLSDIYSAGFVTLELLHGARLVPPSSTVDELLAFKETLPERVSDFLPEAIRGNEQMVAIISRLLAVEPQDRYANAKEADMGDDGARVVMRQLIQAHLDADYGREIESYVNKRMRHR